MTTHTVGGLAGRKAHDGHICRENYEFTDVRGPSPASTFNRIPDLCSRDLDPAAYGGPTLGTILSGSILEFTYIGGPEPPLITNHGQVLHPEGQKSMAHDELT